MDENLQVIYSARVICICPLYCASHPRRGVIGRTKRMETYCVYRLQLSPCPAWRLFTSWYKGDARNITRHLYVSEGQIYLLRTIPVGRQVDLQWAIGQCILSQIFQMDESQMNGDFHFFNKTSTVHFSNLWRCTIQLVRFEWV